MLRLSMLAAALMFVGGAAFAQPAAKGDLQAVRKQDGVTADLSELVTVELPKPDGTVQRLEMPKSLLDPSASEPIELQARQIFTIAREEALRRFRREELFQLIDGDKLSDDVLDLAADFQKNCKPDARGDCTLAETLRQIAPGLRPRPEDAGCVTAANALYVITEVQRRTWHTTQEAATWETECLSEVAQSEIGRTQAGAASTDSLLSSVGILFIGTTPHCSGLLTSDGRFITARHCIGIGPYGNLRVRQANTNAVRGVRRIDQNTAPGVPGDWAVFALLDAPFAGVRDYSVGVPKPGDAAYPVGMSLVSVHRLAPLTDVAAVIRTPRDGKCRVVVPANDCLQLACQTLQGFSGSPIFSIPSAGGEPVLVGLLSGGRNERCETPHLPRATFAVPQALVRSEESQ